MEDPAEHKEKKRKKIPSPHWATRQCLLCWETECNNHTIHFRTGEGIAAIKQVFVSELQISTTIYMQVWL